jgi:hypothetical protein
MLVAAHTRVVKPLLVGSRPDLLAAVRVALA